ncbi:MAG: hypothetical protein WC825_05370, partial [Gallionellaceae bacterium]
MKQNSYEKTLGWLKTNPSLDELCARYPEEWAEVQQEIAAIVERGVAAELKAYLERVSAPSAKPAFGKQQPDKNAALAQFVRSRMAHESVKKLCLS